MDLLLNVQEKQQQIPHFIKVKILPLVMENIELSYNSTPVLNVV